MKKLVLLLIFIITIAFSTSCTIPPDDDEFTIVVNPWIGYTPLFYLDKTGVLSSLGIELVHTVSMGNVKDLYVDKKFDALAGTQHEYFEVTKRGTTIVPAILLDRSNGGDLILGNISIDEIKNADLIDVFLEVDSINLVLFENFMKIHNLPRSKFHYINIDQGKISSLKVKNMERPTLIVTYSPYDVQLVNNGFTMIGSTRDNKDLLIFDALFVRLDSYNVHAETLQKLNKHVIEAISISKANPKQYYNTVKPYIDNISYQEFTETIDNIIWIDTSNTEIIKSINNFNIPTTYILK